MAHFALIGDDDIVENVIVCDVDKIHKFPGEWVQCSYNMRKGQYLLNNVLLSIEDSKPFIEQEPARQRVNYPSVNWSYNREKDVFVSPQYFPSWILNEQTWVYEAPIPIPDPNGVYYWDEEELNWKPQTQ